LSPVPNEFTLRTTFSDAAEIGWASSDGRCGLALDPDATQSRNNGGRRQRQRSRFQDWVLGMRGKIGHFCHVINLFSISTLKKPR
jgi:hypothetical protein